MQQSNGTCALPTSPLQSLKVSKLQQCMHGYDVANSTHVLLAVMVKRALLAVLLSMLNSTAVSHAAQQQAGGGSSAAADRLAAHVAMLWALRTHGCHEARVVQRACIQVELSR
jgi:hypothetical protein